MVGTSDYTAMNCTTMNEHIVKNVKGSSYGQILGIILAFFKKKRKSHKITVTIKNPTWTQKQKFMCNNGNHLPDHRVTSLQSHYHDNLSSEMDSQYPVQGSHQESPECKSKVTLLAQTFLVFLHWTFDISLPLGSGIQNSIWDNCQSFKISHQSPQYSKILFVMSTICFP